MNKKSIEDIDEKKIQNENLGLLSMMLGITSLILFFVKIISIPCAIGGIILGIIAKKNGGKGLALTGIITSAITIGIWIAIYDGLEYIVYTLG